MGSASRLSVTTEMICENLINQDVIDYLTAPYRKLTHPLRVVKPWSCYKYRILSQINKHTITEFRRFKYKTTAKQLWGRFMTSYLYVDGYDI